MTNTSSREGDRPHAHVHVCLCVRAAPDSSLGPCTLPGSKDPSSVTHACFSSTQDRARRRADGLDALFKRPGPHSGSLTRHCSPPAARRSPSLTCPAPRPGHAAGRRCFPAASPPRPQLPEGGALSDFYVPGSAVPGAQWERDTNRSLDSRFQLVPRQQRPRACSEPERSARSPPSAVHLPRDRATHVKTLKTKIHCGN